MTTAELIKKLQEKDPEGMREVFVDAEICDGSDFDVLTNEEYGDPDFDNCVIILVQ
jgi:hypothetical protein